MLLIDLIRATRSSGTLEKMIMGRPEPIRSQLLERMGLIALQEMDEGVLRDEKEALVCIPYVCNSGDVEIYFAIRDHFLRRYRPSAPHILDRLEAPDLSGKERKQLRLEAVRTIFSNYNPSSDIRFGLHKLGALLVSVIPEPLEVRPEEVVKAFLHSFGGALPKIPLPGSGVRIVDPLDCIFSRERAMLKAVIFFRERNTFNPRVMKRVIEDLSLEKTAPIILRCESYETERKTMDRLLDYCEGMFRMKMLTCEDLNHLSGGGAAALYDMELLIVPRFSGCYLNESGERNLKELINQEIRILLMQDPEKPLDIFFSYYLKTFFGSAVEYYLDERG